MEIWKKIDGFDYDYRVSNFGNIRNFTSGNDIVGIVKPNGYRQVQFRKNGRPTHLYAHRLVAQAFIPNPTGLPQVNHKDENKLNNCVDNIEWCTAKENSHHSRVWENPTKITSKTVLQFDKEGLLVGEYKSTGDAHRKTGISQSQIARCCSRKFSQTHGYKFLYEAECI